ncbi:MAG: nucleotide exchange factor GrpE [Patescibacteria group bacterium]
MDKKHKEEEIEETKDEETEEPVKEESIESLKKEIEEIDGKYKRALADYQNLLKSSTEKRAEILKYSTENCLLEILPIYDNLNISINNLSEDQANNPWVEGVKYIIRQFDEFLLKNEVEKIKTVGEKFDYRLMEAIDGQGDYVVKEVRPGYRLKDKVIVPASVTVGDKE